MNDKIQCEYCAVEVLRDDSIMIMPSKEKPQILFVCHDCYACEVLGVVI